MTPEERAKALHGQWANRTLWKEEMISDIERVIVAAIEEEREACRVAARDEHDRARELQDRRGDYGGDMFRAGVTQGRVQAASLIEARIRARSTETKSPKT